MQTPVLHTASPAPVIATGLALLAHLPEALSGMVALASLFYYYLVISEKLAQRRAARAQVKQSADRIAVGASILVADAVAAKETSNAEPA